MQTIFAKSNVTKFGATALVAVLALGIGAPVVAPAFAEAVRVEGVQAPGFADVVQKVQPAVVSVRVTSRVQNASSDVDGERGFDMPRSFEDLPEDHPFRRFFREFDREYRDGQRGDDRRAERRRDRDENRREQRRERRGPISQGSGFFISEDGYIVTNNHVVEGGASFTIVMDDATELEARLIGTDPRTDLALLKVDDAAKKFTYVAFADDAKARVGDWVVAIGNPFGLGGTVTAGIVSGLGRDIGAGPYADFIQIDAAVNRGNSGGPAFNLNGEVVGVNTAIFSPSGGNVGIAFAIPASTANEVINELKENGNVTRGFIGVRIQPLTAELAETLGLKDEKGALVSSVVPDAPAAKAGIEAGDVIVSVDGQSVNNPRQLTRRIGGIQPGATAKIDVIRDGKPIVLSLELTKLETQTASAAPETTTPEAVTPSNVEQFGLEVVPNDNGDGVVVTSVDPDGLAADQGLRAGDVITEVNGTAIKAAGDIGLAVDNARKEDRRNVLMMITRENNPSFIALPIKRG
jgi:serine protease Do